GWLVGVGLGWFLWHVEGVVTGDGLFHEARVRKLVDLTSLHLRSVDEFKDGGLHPGYAFPLWHGLLALVSWFSGVDPGVALRHSPSLLAPIACAVAWEAGVAVFGSRWAGWSLLVVLLAVFCFGPGHGGSWATLALPGTAARQLLVPAAIALFFTRRWLPTAAIFGALALTHPTYALFLLIPLLGFAVVRATEWRRWAPTAAAAIVPTGLALLWLKPIVDETVSHDPGPAERLRALHHYGDQLVVTNLHHYRLAPEVFGRRGAAAVAALVLLPVAALVAPRRRWAAFAAGGTAGPRSRPGSPSSAACSRSRSAPSGGSRCASATRSALRPRCSWPCRSSRTASGTGARACGPIRMRSRRGSSIDCAPSCRR